MTQATIEKRVRFWQEKMGLTNWDIDVQFQNVKYQKETENFKGFARTHVESTYKMATVIFVPKYIKLIDDSIIVHELLHCLLGELMGYSNGRRASVKQGDGWLIHFEEQVVSELERIIMRLYKDKNKSAS